MKRFWDTARVAPGATGRFGIVLDGKPMRLPGGGPLALESCGLAEAIAAEWQAAGGAKGGEMSLAEVPLTRLAGTLQERVAPDPAPVAAALATYGQSDLLCYRASEPAPLVARQQRLWQPWLDWSAETLGARLRVTQGVMPVAQEPAALARLHAVLAAQTPAVLAALSLAVPALGSLVLGLAMAGLRLGAAAAVELAFLDELFQAELWGEDAQAASRRRAVAADVVLSQRFIELCAEGA